MRTLRGHLVRLAYSEPKLRPHLLPLLRGAAEEPDWAKGKKFRHPKTRNEVSFGSLPPEAQAELRKKHEKGKGKGEGTEGGGKPDPKHLKDAPSALKDAQSAIKSMAENLGGGHVADDVGYALKAVQRWQRDPPKTKKHLETAKSNFDSVLEDLKEYEDRNKDEMTVEEGDVDHEAFKKLQGAIKKLEGVRKKYFSGK